MALRVVAQQVSTVVEKVTQREMARTAVMCWSKNSGWLPAAKQSIVAWRVGPSPGGWMQYLRRQSGSQ